MKTTQIKCHYCKTEIKKDTSDVNRAIKLGRPMFCNLSCFAKYRNNMMPKSHWKSLPQNINFKNYAGNRQDEKSPFRPYLNKGRASNIKHDMQLTAEYLKSLWEKQNGICPYTGIKMILPKNTKENWSIYSLKKASLDRIDSAKGYVEGNVEFVCMAINNAKYNFKKEEMKSFIKEIISSYQNTISITQEQPS